MKITLLITIFFAMNTANASPNGYIPKIPQDLLHVSEKNTEKLMNRALLGDLNDLGDVRRTLQLSLEYRGNGAPYFSSPHKASKQVLLWYIISALIGEEGFSDFLENGVHNGFYYDYETGKPCHTYYVNDYMKYFLLSEKERKYYQDRLSQDPNNLLVNYYLYMDSKQRGDSDWLKYLKNIKGKVPNALLSKEIVIDSKKKTMTIKDRENRN